MDWYSVDTELVTGLYLFYLIRLFIFLVDGCRRVMMMGRLFEIFQPPTSFQVILLLTRAVFLLLKKNEYALVRISLEAYVKVNAKGWFFYPK